MAVSAASLWAADVPHGRVKAARLNNLGVALMNQQLTEKALGEFDEAHAADPSMVVLQVNRGIALLYMQRLPEADAALTEAARLDPKNPSIWYSLGLVHRSEGKPELAIGDFQHVVAIDPSDADTHYFLGSSHFEAQQFDKALGEFQAALRLNPVHASAVFGLARTLQRLGKNDEAREQLKYFSHLTHDKISSPLTTVYGEQGHYATVQDVLLPEPPVGAMIPVQFESQPVHGAVTTNAVQNGGLGGGACILDITGAGHKDLIVLGSGEHAIHAYRNLGNGSFEEIADQQTGLSASGNAIACTVGDYDNDKLPDLAVAFSDRVVLFHNLGHGKFADVTSQVGIRSLNHPAGLTFVDFDHDGDLDLFVTGSAGAKPGMGPNVLWRNNGNSTFTEWTEPTGLAGQGKTVGAVLSDVNNDRAVDLVVTGSEGAPTFFANPREGRFKSAPLYDDENLAATVGIYALDFNKDEWMDFAVTHAGAPGISLWRNVDGKRFERVDLPVKGIQRAWGVTGIDIDNDGWIDLAAVVETSHGTELRVFRNRGPEGFEDVTSAVGLDKVKLQNARSVIAADVDGDGAADLIVTQLGGLPVVLRNVGGSKNHSLRIDLTGLADNKSAIGTKVDVLADGHRQKFEVAGGSGYLSQGSTEILAGLGQATQADVVRLLWPTGVPQDEINLPVSKVAAIQELDRRGSSCPVLFAWDGKEYRFVSDVIGAAVVGHWVSPTAMNQGDPDEWIKVDGADLKARDGFLSLRFGEPMEEINFIDQVRLIAVDHPDGTEVYPDEKFLSEPPFASGKTVVTSNAHPLAGAWDDKGRNVLDLLRERDHKYVRDFKDLKFAGYANQHTLTLDLGAWTPRNPLRLLMHGYIEYFSASSMYAAWQAGLKPVPPYVEAQMPDGSWKRVIDDMGFPAGLPRTIVVDLTGKLPVGTRRIRLTTNLQIYWDQVLVDNGPDISRTARQTELPLSTAHLAFRGYPQQIEGATPGDLTYDYQKISTTGPFAWQRGSYTRYGNVTPLLKKVDDQYVIFGSGEEIDVEFSATTLPPLPPHWKRDYFFYANGFVKDMDFYEALPFTVAEMPFHGMRTYPYPATMHYPDTAATLRYRLNWNDRFESGDRIQPYRFNYQPTVSKPIINGP
jgi:tetratricopeptide (TPR) repeat protein